MPKQEGFIYTLSCPNTDLVRYVGQTVDIKKRYNLHLFHSKNGRFRTHKEKWINTLINADQKPVVEVVWSGDVSHLDQKETEFIALYKSFGANLTNATLGGLTTRGRKCSDETRALMSSLMKGRFLRPPITDAEKKAISERMRFYTTSEETTKKISESKKGKCSFWTDNLMPDDQKRRIAALGVLKAKAIVAIKDEVETVYGSTQDAAKATGCDRKTMRMVANGVYKQCKGYQFRFL